MNYERPSVAVFSYGTLQLPKVQLATYGRLLNGAVDTLVGYRLEPLAISDPEVIRISGKAVHTVSCRSADPSDRIEGVVFLITEAELAATDLYEVDVYGRVVETLASGRDAHVYVGPPLCAKRS